MVFSLVEHGNKKNRPGGMVSTCFGETGRFKKEGKTRKPSLHFFEIASTAHFESRGAAVQASREVSRPSP
jgi:hypothetical protein